MGTTLVIKQHDLLPRLNFTLTESGLPVDLALVGAADITVRGVDGIKIQKPVVLANQAIVTNRGQGYYAWVVGDTDVVGLYKAEIRVLWPGGIPQTFPSGGYFTIKIVDYLRD